MNQSFPTLTKQEVEDKIELSNKENDGWEFLFLLTDYYFKFIASFENEEKAYQEFNDEQHTLLAFNYLYGQVYNGGFIQLIQNGYGSYIFDNPFSEKIKQWGAKDISEIVAKAKTIYDRNKDKLEENKSMEEFSKLYDDYKEFEALDDKFYDVMDFEVHAIKDYVYKNIEKFAYIK